MDREVLRLGGHEVANESYWIEEARRDERSRPMGVAASGEPADLVVLGGGFAGLSAAWHFLRERPGSRVVLLEAGRVGEGASARSAGMLPTPLMGLVWALGGATRSDDDADWAFRATCRRLERFVFELGAPMCDDAELHACTNVLTARDAVWSGVVERLGERFADLGVETEQLTPSATRDRFGVHSHGAIAYPGFGTQPARLALALRDAIVRLGADLREDTRVEAVVRDGGRVRVALAGGETVLADGCVVALGAWAETLGLRAKTRPEVVQSWILATEPLSPDRLRKVGDDPRALIAQMGSRGAPLYHRVHRNRLIYGAFSEAGHALSTTVDQATLERLHRSALKAMPWLDGVGIDFAWGGPMFGMTHDLPLIEAYPALPRTALIVPNAATGVGWSLLSGGMVGAIVSEDGIGDAEGERLRGVLCDTRMPWPSIGSLYAGAAWKAIARAA